MKFLIVGASGFIGRHLLTHVRSLGLEAIGTQARSRVPGLLTFDLLQHRIGDCVSRSFFEGQGPFYVVICAVISDMDLCLTDPVRAHAVNVEKIIQLIEDVRNWNATPVFISTNYVFDGRIGYYTEEHPVSPANAYGRHKAEVEQYLQRNIPDALIIRPDKNIGDDPCEYHFFSTWYRLLTAGQPIVCIEGQLISPTYVDDTARAIVMACRMGLTGVYHVVNPEYFHRDELARQFCFAAGMSPSVICKPIADFHFPDNRALKAYLDGSKFRRTTGMQFTTVREVMQRFMQKVRQMEI